MKDTQTIKTWRSFAERRKKLGKEKAGAERAAMALRSNENLI